MKLIIFGATGTIGRHLVAQALAQGHEVTAFARRLGALELDHPALTRQAGRRARPGGGRGCGEGT